MDEFHYVSYPQEVIFVRGALARLNEALDRVGCQRLMLCSNHTLRQTGQVAGLESVLGDRLVAVFDQVQPHVQDVQVAEAAQLASDKRVQAVIGMGGGSPIGMAKAVAARLDADEPAAPQAGLPPNLDTPASPPSIPVIAIPTTYAGSEMTAVYGITYTREQPPRKVTVKNPRILPKLVLYDPQLTLDLPPEMTASTGINALAHCIEALYSIQCNPLSTAAAVSGVRHIMNALPRCYRDGSDLEARGDMLLGAHLAGVSLASVAMGLHHGLCHVLGGTTNVPHGIANSIILPHAIQFNAATTAVQLLPAVEAMGIPTKDRQPAAAVEDAIEKITDLIGQMGLPQHLRQAGVAEADLPRLAQLAYQNHSVQNNPRPITDAGQIEALLRAAW